MTRETRDREAQVGWMTEYRPAGTKCKHGFGDCDICGTREATDVIHTARTTDKRTARRMRRKANK